VTCTISQKLEVKDIRPVTVDMAWPCHLGLNAVDLLVRPLSRKRGGGILKWIKIRYDNPAHLPLCPRGERLQRVVSFLAPVIIQTSVLQL
jgi:hypothetical protein